MNGILASIQGSRMQEEKDPLTTLLVMFNATVKLAINHGYMFHFQQVRVMPNYIFRLFALFFNRRIY